MLRYLFIFIGALPSIVIGQCIDMEQHNTSIIDEWVSCDQRVSPLGGTERSHWIMYEFDAVLPVESIRLWNINHPLYLTFGASQIKVETSSEGARWISRDTLSLDRASGTNDYRGVEFDEFEPYDAKFVLLTILDNHGGQCTGLSEVRFSLGEVTTSIAETYLADQVLASPNPADQQVSIDISALDAEVRSYRIIDMTGREHAFRSLSQSGNRRTLNIETSELPSGTYALHLNTDEGSIAKPIVVVHPN